MGFFIPQDYFENNSLFDGAVFFKTGRIFYMKLLPRYYNRNSFKFCCGREPYLAPAMPVIKKIFNCIFDCSQGQGVLKLFKWQL